MLKISVLTLVFINEYTAAWKSTQLHYVFKTKETKNSADELPQKVEIQSLNNKW